MNTEYEPGVCVCCRAEGAGTFAEEIPVCKECMEDGTFMSWLMVHLRKSLTEEGYTFETRNGVEYAKAPKRIDDATP